MIPLRKLEKLPRNQRLRKIAKMFAEAEHTVNHYTNMGGVSFFNAETLSYFAEITTIPAADGFFSAAAAAALGEAALVLRQAAAMAAERPAALDAAAVRRALNTVRHILSAETGCSPADWDFIDGGGRLDPGQRRVFPGMLVYLEDIRSPFNVGAMFRTAESFGAERLFLSPLCADPRHPRAIRSAMGCVDVLPWERRELADLPSGPVFAMETGGIPLAEFPFPEQGLLIAGSEELGVSPQALTKADASLGRVTIPSYGAKASLNVSVAFGIVTQAWTATLTG